MKPTADESESGDGRAQSVPPRQRLASGRMESGLRDPDGLIGTLVGGKYRVMDVVARGGMGRIYRAEQIPLGRPVALKVLHSELGETGDTGFQKRFLLEAASCARLTHPNIVVVYDYGRVEESARESYFIAMELLEGRTLGQIMRDEGAMPPAVVLRIAREVARALREAHRQGMVHRDLKPSNVMIATSSEGDHVKVLDFGLVKVVRDDSEELTKEGHFLGSPKYMAPEQIRRGPVDGRADLYSLGVLMYQMLSGSLPFEGDQPVQTLMAHLTDAVPPLPPAVPADVAALVYRTLEKTPDTRWRSASEFIAAVDHTGQAIGWSGIVEQMSGETAMHTGAFQVSPSSPGSVPGVRPLGSMTNSIESSLGSYGSGGFGSPMTRASVPPGTTTGINSSEFSRSLAPGEVSVAGAFSSAPPRRRRGGIVVAALIVGAAAIAGALFALYGGSGDALGVASRDDSARVASASELDPGGGGAGDVNGGESAIPSTGGAHPEPSSDGTRPGGDESENGPAAAPDRTGSDDGRAGAGSFTMFVRSRPSGAALRRVGESEVLGRTPTFVQLETDDLRNDPVTFLLELPGHAPFRWTQGTSPRDVEINASLDRIRRPPRGRTPPRPPAPVEPPPPAERRPPGGGIIKTRR